MHIEVTIPQLDELLNVVSEMHATLRGLTDQVSIQCRGDCKCDAGSSTPVDVEEANYVQMEELDAESPTPVDATKPKRRRRTKAEIEAARMAETTMPVAEVELIIDDPAAPDGVGDPDGVELPSTMPVAEVELIIDDPAALAGVGDPDGVELPSTTSEPVTLVQLRSRMNSKAMQSVEMRSAMIAVARKYHPQGKIALVDPGLFAQILFEVENVCA